MTSNAVDRESLQTRENRQLRDEVKAAKEQQHQELSKRMDEAVARGREKVEHPYGEQLKMAALLDEAESKAAELETTNRDSEQSIQRLQRECDRKDRAHELVTKALDIARESEESLRAEQGELEEAVQRYKMASIEETAKRDKLELQVQTLATKMDEIKKAQDGARDTRDDVISDMAKTARDDWELIAGLQTLNGNLQAEVGKLSLNHGMLQRVLQAEEKTTSDLRQQIKTLESEREAQRTEAERWYLELNALQSKFESAESRATIRELAAQTLKDKLAAETCKALRLASEVSKLELAAISRDEELKAKDDTIGRLEGPE
jgi:chromosome segregation ATPase